MKTAKPKEKKKVAAPDPQREFVALKESNVAEETPLAVKIYIPTTADKSGGIVVWVPKSVWMTKNGTNYLRRWFIEQKKLTELSA